MTDRFIAKIDDCFRSRRGLLLVLGLSIGIKTAILLLTEVVNPDAPLYIGIAQNFSEGSFEQGISQFSMPFYPLLIAGVQLLVPDWILAGQVISFLSLVLVTIPFYFLTAHLFDNRTAFWSALAFSLSPHFNGYVGDLIRDPVFLLFFSFAFYFGCLAFSSRKWSHYLLASVFSIFSFLCRVEGVLLPLIFLSTSLFILAFGQSDRKGILRGVLSFLLPYGTLAFILFLVFGGDIYSINRLGFVADQFKNIFSLEFLSTYHLVYAKIAALEQELPGAALTTNFSRVARHHLWLIYLIGVFQGLGKLISPIFLPFLLLGCCAGNVLNRRRLFPIMVFCVYAFGGYLFLLQRNFLDLRYLVIPAFLLLPLVGAGLLRGWTAVSRSRWPRVAAGCFFLVVFVLPAYKSLAHLNHQNVVTKVAGAWLKERPDLQSLKIASTGNRIPFYAGRGRDFTRIFPPPGSLENCAEGAGAELLLIETSAKRRKRVPELRNFTLVKEFERRGQMALIYRRNS